MVFIYSVGLATQERDSACLGGNDIGVRESRSIFFLNYILGGGSLCVANAQLTNPKRVCKHSRNLLHHRNYAAILILSSLM